MLLEQSLDVSLTSAAQKSENCKTLEISKIFGGNTKLLCLGDNFSHIAQSLATKQQLLMNPSEMTNVMSLTSTPMPKADVVTKRFCKTDFILSGSVLHSPLHSWKTSRRPPKSSSLVLDKAFLFASTRSDV